MRVRAESKGRVRANPPEATTERHVAAMPFPARLGTQVYIQAVVEAQFASGKQIKVLTYARGAGTSTIDAVLERPAKFTPQARPRSGPTFGKLKDDLLLWRALRRTPPAARTIAHHLEACILCALTAHRPLTYVAHTCLEEELPTYLPGWVGERANHPRVETRLGRLLQQPGHLVSRALMAAVERAGRRFDSLARRLADESWAVSPALGQRLGIPALPLPEWPPLSEQRAVAGCSTDKVEPRSGEATHITGPSTLSLLQATPSIDSRAARRALALPPAAPLLAYFGNLDGYQGAEILSEVLALLPESWALLLMTDSPAPAWAQAHPKRVFYRRLSTRHRRALGYASADVVIVTRKCGAGIPIKLLDALAQGVPVVAQARALAGFTELAQRDACRLLVVPESKQSCCPASSVNAPSQKLAKVLAEAVLAAARAAGPAAAPPQRDRSEPSRA